MRPRCDFNLEDIKPTFLYGTSCQGDAPPYQVWLKKDEQFRRYCLNKTWTHRQMDKWFQYHPPSFNFFTKGINMQEVKTEYFLIGQDKTVWDWMPFSKIWHNRTVYEVSGDLCIVKARNTNSNFNINMILTKGKTSNILTDWILIWFSEVVDMFYRWTAKRPQQYFSWKTDHGLLCWNVH